MMNPYLNINNFIILCNICSAHLIPRTPVAVWSCVPPCPTFRDSGWTVGLIPTKWRKL